MNTCNPSPAALIPFIKEQRERLQKPGRRLLNPGTRLSALLLRLSRRTSQAPIPEQAQLACDIAMGGGS